MKAKTIVTGILAAFVVLSVVYLVAREAGTDGVGETPTDTQANTARSPGETGEGAGLDGTGPVDKVVVYYFHGNRRCPTCIKIENYAEEAIRTNFSDDLVSGRIEWRVVNTDELENSHFVQDYNLVAQALVLVGMDDDVEIRSKNLRKIWQYVHFKPQFTDYVVESIREFMAGSDG